MNPFRKKPKLPEYRFQNAPQGDATWVQITSGKYSGVIYSYGMVKFSEDFGIPKLNFNFNIINCGKYTEEVLKNDQDYVTIMGEILTDIIINNEPTRNNDTEESDLY